MSPFAGVDWAVNAGGEILVAMEFNVSTLTPEVFVVADRVGILVFEGSVIADIVIPAEILVSVAAAADILVVSLRGGAVLAEKHVPISHA